MAKTTIGTEQIGDGSLVNADISPSAAIAFSKLATLTAGQVLLGNASNVPTATAISGDISLSDAGVVAISSGVIVNADISASAAIAHSKLAGLGSGQIIVGSNVGAPTARDVTGDVTIGNTGITAIAPGVIVNADINTSAAIALSKLQSVTAGNFLIGNASNVVVPVTISGDITIDVNGVAAIASGVIINTDINASAAIAYSKLSLSNGIVNADINSAAAIDGSKINPAFGSQNLTATGSVSLYESGTDISRTIFIGNGGGTSGWTFGSGVTAHDGLFRLYSNDTTATIFTVDSAAGNLLTFTSQLKLTAGSPGLNKVLTSDANGLATWAGVPYDFGGQRVAAPTASLVIMKAVAARAVSFAANFSGSYGVCSPAATGSTTFSIKKNGSEIGTMVFAASGATSTFTTTSGAAQSLAAGDILTVVAPGSPDATLADLSFILKGTA